MTVASAASGRGCGIRSSSELTSPKGWPVALRAAAATRLKCRESWKTDAQERPSSSSAYHGECSSVDWIRLQEAWMPFSMAFKRLWWEAIAVPSDIDEDDFREQLK